MKAFYNILLGFCFSKWLTLSTDWQEDKIWTHWESLIFSRIEKCFNSYQDYPYKQFIISMINLSSYKFE